jgi:hypothetical protein
MSIPEYATCKKCGDSVRGYTYCDGRHCGRSGYSFDNMGEHMHRRCYRCGYSWKTPVLEKK